MRYASDLTANQKLIITASLPESITLPRKYDFFDIFNAILYVVKTGCQWHMLPSDLPPWKAAYHHFRSWSDRGWLDTLLSSLVKGKRASEGESPDPETAVVDSRSVRSGLPHSEKGVDGHKRIKGIKEHLATDKNGYPLAIHVTTANAHDSKAAYPLIANVISTWSEIAVAKADKGYGGPLAETLALAGTVKLECVKSNFGTSQFIPIDGRWVVERTFAWLENYRRVCRNYEKLLRVARHMAVFASLCIMLRHFR